MTAKTALRYLKYATVRKSSDDAWRMMQMQESFLLKMMIDDDIKNGHWWNDEVILTLSHYWH